MRLWLEYANSVRDYQNVYAYLMANDQTLPLSYRTPIQYSNLTEQYQRDFNECNRIFIEGIQKVGKGNHPKELNILYK